VLALALSADGHTLVSDHADQRVRCWHTPMSRCDQTWHCHSRMVLAVAISADGQTIAGGSTDRTICLVQNLSVLVRLSLICTAFNLLDFCTLKTDTPNRYPSTKGLYLNNKTKDRLID
jgi:WD40 repeat protein